MPCREKKRKLVVIALQTRLRRTDTDMTKGSVLGRLVAFAVPLLIGNIFQQLYNTVDSVVVGNFVGKEALAAVGSVAPVVNMLIGFFNGFATGAGVIISRHYGAQQKENVHIAVQTTIAMTLLMSVVLSICGVLLTPALLRMMKTPEDVIAHSSEYLRIYFAGLSGLLLYNMGAGILRAVGDTRRPLYFLIFSAVTNTVLDLLFVTVFRHGRCGRRDRDDPCAVCLGGAGDGGADALHERLPHRVVRNAAEQEDVRQHLQTGLSGCGAACGHILLQYLCPVVYQPLRRGLHGRLDFAQ